MYGRFVPTEDFPPQNLKMLSPYPPEIEKQMQEMYGRLSDRAIALYNT